MKNKQTISYDLSHKINGFIQSYFAQFSHILVGKVSYQQIFSGIAAEKGDLREPQFELPIRKSNSSVRNISVANIPATVKLIVVIPIFNTGNYVPNGKEKKPYDDISMEKKRPAHRSHFGDKSLALAILRLIHQFPTKNHSHSLFRSTSEHKNNGLTGLPKEVEVQYVELQYPYLDRTILAQYLSVNASKYNFTRMHKTVFRKTFSDFFPVPSYAGNGNGTMNENKVSDPIQQGSHHIPSSEVDRNSERNMETQKEKNTSTTTLSSRSINHSVQKNLIRLKGLKIELAGRLSTQRNIPRKTVNNRHTGSFNCNSNGSMNQYTSKNKIGAYNIKV